MSYNKVIVWGKKKSIDKRSSRLKSIQHLSILEKLKEKPKSIFDEDLFYWRKKILDKFELFANKELSGTILEIGAGTAVSSAYASTFKKVKKIYSLDYSWNSVENLMPYVHNLLNANLKKINRVFGSFDSLAKSKIKFDLIWGVGAFHNSKNLDNTFVECFKSLKKGGYLMVSDMCDPDYLSNYFFKNKNSQIVPNSKKNYKSKVSYKEASDYFRPMREYLHSANKAGFEVAPYIFDEKYGRPAGDEIFIKKEIYNGHQLITFKPYFKKLNGRYDQMLLICYKGHEKENKNNFIFTKKNKLFYFNFYLSDFYVNKIKNFFVKVINKIMSFF